MRGLLPAPINVWIAGALQIKAIQTFRAEPCLDLVIISSDSRSGQQIKQKKLEHIGASFIGEAVFLRGRLFVLNI